MVVPMKPSPHKIGACWSNVRAAMDPNSSGSSGRVREGRETWNLCGRLWRPSFLWLIFTGPVGACPPPWIRYCPNSWYKRVKYVIKTILNYWRIQGCWRNPESATSLEQPLKKKGLKYVSMSMKRLESKPYVLFTNTWQLNTRPFILQLLHYCW